MASSEPMDVDPSTFRQDQPAPTSGAKALIWPWNFGNHGVRRWHCNSPPQKCKMCMMYASHLMDALITHQIKLWSRCQRGGWHCLALDHQKHPALCKGKCKGEKPWPWRRGQGDKRQGPWPWRCTGRPVHWNRKAQGHHLWPWEGTWVIQKDLSPWLVQY